MFGTGLLRMTSGLTRLISRRDSSSLFAINGSQQANLHSQNEKVSTQSCLDGLLRKF